MGLGTTRAGSFEEGAEDGAGEGALAGAEGAFEEDGVAGAEARGDVTAEGGGGVQCWQRERGGHLAHIEARRGSG